MFSLSIELRGGPEQLARISRQLKEEANRGLQRELSKALNQATKPLKAALRDSARATLPKRGGLADKVARSRVSTRRVVKGNTAGVRVVATNQHSIRQIDRGKLRHPVFGNEEVWVTQPVTPGWWSKPIESAAPAAQKAVAEAIGRVADRIERAGRGL